MDEVDGIPLPSPVLARADALMHRRRPTGAGEADDLPVLTEIVDDGIPVLAETLPPPAPGPAFDADQLNLLAEELAHRLRSRLAAELPSLVEAALNAAVAACFAAEAALLPGALPGSSIIAVARRAPSAP